MTKEDQKEYNKNYYIKNKENILIKQKISGISEKRKISKRVYRKK